MGEQEQKKIFARNLNHYITNSGKQQKAVAKELGYSPTTFNTWCMGKIIPSMGKVQRIADYFGIGKSDLLEDKDGGPVAHPTLRPDEFSLLQHYNKLNPTGKEKARDYVTDLSEQEKYTSEDPSEKGPSSFASNAG